MCISDVLYAVLFCLIVEVCVSLLKALEISKEAVFLVKQTFFVFCTSENNTTLTCNCKLWLL